MPTSKAPKSPQPNNPRHVVQNAKRVVIKLGTSVLTQGSPHLSKIVFENLASEISNLRQKGIELVLVTSGAIAAGKQFLSFKKGNLTIPEKQAIAAIGQPVLMNQYQKSFAQHEITTAQILLTHDDLSNRLRYLNAKHTLLTLLQKNILPIINENDTVVVDEIKFGDNDTLSALITSCCEADLLIILTDRDGLFDKNPVNHQDARLIPLVEKINQHIWQSADDQCGKQGIGGMRTKIEAAERAATYGVPTLIANGFDNKILHKLLNGKTLGTLFLPEADRLASRKHWIAHNLRAKGTLTLDPGAVNALCHQGKSLLPSGILKVSGDFEVGDAVLLADENNKSLGQGLVSYNAKELSQIAGHQTDEIESLLGYKYYDEVIHRDDLVLTLKDKKGE